MLRRTLDPAGQLFVPSAALNLPGLQFDPEHPDQKWFPTKVAGVSWFALHLEADSQAAQGDSAVLIKMEPGCGYPAHRHRGPEDVLVLCGGYRDERGQHLAGDQVHYPAGSCHAPVACGDASSPASAACVLYAVVQRGVDLL